STGSIYANSYDPLREDSPIQEIESMGVYPLSKLSGECVLKQYSDDFKVVILRLFFVYGAGANRGMLIPRIVSSVKQGEEIILQGDDGLLITPTFAGDVAHVIGRAIEGGSCGTYNVAGPRP